jgi:hypothetical protein
MQKLVYHYCSVEAAKGILAGQHLWVSDIAKMNDPKEFEAGFRIASSLIQERFGHAQEVLDEILREKNSDNTKILSASFSADPDCLTLWRLYANNCAGVALGVDPIQVVQSSLFSRYLEKMGPVTGKPIFFDVCYSQELLVAALSEYLTAFDVSSPVSRGMLKTALLRLCYTYKASHWVDEREIRLAIEVDSLVDPYALKNRDGKYGSTIYHELPLQFSSGAPSAVKEVRLGPVCSEVDKLFERNDVTIKRSSIDYR